MPNYLLYRCHGIEFYYTIETKQKLEIKDYKTIEIDKKEEKLLEFKWVTVEELKNIDLRPNSIRDILIKGQYVNGLTHIVKRSE